jgi:membrane protease YdiL (CAAX protease family)
MPARVDPLRLALQIGLYIFFHALVLSICLLIGLPALMGMFAGSALAIFLGAVITNVITLRIYEGRKLSDIGFHWSPASQWNLALGLTGGAASAFLVLAAPLVFRAASMRPSATHENLLGRLIWITLFLILGAAGEEILFRGYGFQVLLRSIGPFTTILPVGVLFGLLHSSNPHASNLGLINTAGFGILFGYAFLRSRDLWLPFGLHFGWNFTLPFFGTDLSGVKMVVTGYELQWKAGVLWSGGEYGPEASILTSGVLLALFVFLWKAPIRPQPNLLLDEPVEKLNASPFGRSSDPGADGRPGSPPER